MSAAATATRDGGATARVPTPERLTERKLLTFALLIVVAAYLLLGLSREANIAMGTIVYGGALAAMAAIAHATVSRFAPYATPLLLPVVFLLNGLGLVLVRRIDFARGSSLAVAQTTWTAVGIGAFALTLLAVKHHSRITRYHYTAGLATLILLLLPLMPVISPGPINGARLWVRVAGMTIQPGEIAKITMVIFLAGYLADKRPLLAVATQRVGPFLLPPARHLAPVVAAAGVAIAVMVSQRDLGSSLLFLGVFVLLLYTATGRLAYPVIGGMSFVAGAGIAYALFGHVRVRFQVWLDPWADIDGAGYQIAQAQFAFATGGLTGTGLGLGRPADIPFVWTDAIFAVVGEELGLLGTTAVLLLFLLIIAKGFRIALSAPDDVGTLLATGLTAIIALQVFVIIGGLTRVMPFTGITLPFVSYGGSSLVANYVLLALLLRIHDDGRRAAMVGPDRQRGAT